MDEVDEITQLFGVLDAFEDGALGADDAMAQILALYPRVDDAVETPTTV